MEAWTNHFAPVAGDLDLEKLISAVAELRVQAPIPTRVEVGRRAYMLLSEWSSQAREAIWKFTDMPLVVDPELPPRAVRVYALPAGGGTEVLWDEFQIDDPALTPEGE